MRVAIPRPLFRSNDLAVGNRPVDRLDDEVERVLRGNSGSFVSVPTTARLQDVGNRPVIQARSDSNGYVATRHLLCVATLILVEVGIRELRAGLSRYMKKVHEGEEIVVTDRGAPVARIVPMNGRRKIDRLIAAGLVEPAPRKTPRSLPKPIKIEGGVSDLVDEQRR